jgi:acyl-coenzyme A thioesterase PaaI-like protein
MAQASLMSTSGATADQGGAFSSQGSDAVKYFHSIVANHPAALEFQQRTSIQKSHSVLVIRPEDLPYSLLGTTLAGSEAVAQPYVFMDDEAGSLLAFYYLGRRLAGHVGIVHGGMAEVILDECMGRACFPRLPGKIAVTAKLELQYKNPIPVNSIILIRADTKDVQGRKAWVEAIVQDANDGHDLVKATALFVQPKWAAEMSKVM